ncbi:amidase [Aureimonas populi]|uniref:Indoleacetamide hydrolase n=1 Tax=Aureimonas populi TaxID=1701758 RepID=A0ABW5CJ05_9HYPH
MLDIPSHAVALSRPLALGSGSLRVAVKECIAVAGLPTRCGSPALQDSPPQAAHARVVEALLAAGCAILGTANMHELAFGVTGVNAFLGTPVNPNWPARIPGGSSSGSAALVAPGTCDFTVGTDTGGSVRMPACCCGVFGLKPTFGRIDRTGTLPAESSLDCIGPLAASAGMLARAMECLDPTFRRADAAGPFQLVRIEAEAAGDVAAAFAGALAGVATRPGLLPCMRPAYEAGLVVIDAEAGRAYGALAASGAPMDETVRARILQAVKSFSPGALERAEAVRRAFRAEVDRALESADALVLPTMPVVPPTLEEARDMRALIPLTALLRPFNLSGHPALTVPLRTAEGLPAGLQLVGRHGEDERLCAVAEWLARRIAGEPANLPGQDR